MRNICFFCKRRCDGCLLEADFRINIEDNLALKEGEMKIYINVTPKLELVKVRQDIASTGDATIKDCITLYN